MCYRFAYGDVEVVKQKYKVSLAEDDFAKLKNPFGVFPQEYAPVISQLPDNKLYLHSMRWGLIPFWAKDEKIGKKLFNARIETIAIKPSYKDSLKNNRCIIPVVKFYETQRQKDKNISFSFTLKDTQLFSLAGVYSNWINPITKKIIKTFTVITAPANQSINDIHDRMPLTLNTEMECLWLSPNGGNKDSINGILQYNKSLSFEKNEEG